MMNMIITIFLVIISNNLNASEHVKEPISKIWQFDGIFGSVDRKSAQRGYQVYKEVCSSCHSMKLIAYRNLITGKHDKQGIGFSIEEVKALAKEYKYKDIDDNGEEIERTGLPSDRFVSPYANERSARASNNGANPPDLSLIIKSRGNGANYVYSLLNGYGKTPPPELKMQSTQYYNPYFPGGLISMPQPLSDNQVTYNDGTKATIDQMAYDVVNLLQWTAEPEMESRKRMGIKVTLFLSIFTFVFYLAKRAIWSRIQSQ